MNLKFALLVLKQAGSDWVDDKVSRLSAALAFYTLFSLSPLLLITIAIVGTVFGEQAAQGEIVGQIRGLVGTEGAKVIEEAIRSAAKPELRGWASIIGIITLVFGATGVFVELQDALNSVWEVEPKSKEGITGSIGGFLRARLVSFSAILGIGFLLIVSLVVSAALSALGTFFSNVLPGGETLWQAVNFLISFAVITTLFAVIFKYIPDVLLRWRDVWVGAAFTSLLFSLGKFALGLYLGKGTLASTYGAAGSLVILLVWIYYSSQIFFFGAEITQAYVHLKRGRIEPAKHAQKIPAPKR